MSYHKNVTCLVYTVILSIEKNTTKIGNSYISSLLQFIFPQNKVTFTFLY